MRSPALRMAFAASALFSAALSAGPAFAASRPSKRYTIEQFMATTSVGGASFSPDESTILFSPSEPGTFNASVVPPAGGEPAPLTASKTDTTFAVSYFPKDERILFTRDQGGNELNHLYVRDPDGKEKDLTPGEKLKAAFAGFTPAGDAFYVTTNERDPRFFDVYRYDARTYERTLFYKNEKGYFAGP